MICDLLHYMHGLPIGLFIIQYAFVMGTAHESHLSIDADSFIFLKDKLASYILTETMDIKIKCYTGWPRKNAISTITNFKEIRD